MTGFPEPSLEPKEAGETAKCAHCGEEIYENELPFEGEEGYLHRECFLEFAESRLGVSFVALSLGYRVYQGGGHGVYAERNFSGGRCVMEEKTRKPRYAWWSYIKEIVKAYPGRAGLDLQGVKSREYEAVRDAAEQLRAAEDGGSRIRIIQVLYWNRWKTLTLDGAAAEVPCSRATAARWRRQFFETVARNMGLLD